MLRSDGVTWVFAGKTALFRFADGDSAMRNIAVAALRQIGFSGTQVAAALGLTTNYVATLHQRAQRDGTAGLVRPRGRPRTVTGQDWEQARAWRAAGVRDAEIARRLGVQQSTVLRRLGPAQVQGELEPQDAAAAPGPAAAASREDQPLQPGPEAVPGHDEQEPGQTERAPQPEPGVVPPGFAGTARAAEGSGVFSRYAGAMLMHAYPGRAGEILLQAGGGGARDVALLSMVSMCFALGAATAEQVKHLAPAEAGPLAGLAALPSLRTLRPRLAAVAGAADPLALQAAFAAAMLAANPETSGVYYVDGHFVPYAGAKPVVKGWNNKRGRAERGRADTHVTTADGRAVCFVTGEPSGLSVTLPKALAELKKTVPEGTQIMLGFDRGGAYPAVFTHCRDNNVHWVTYRRAPLAIPGMLPVLTVITVNGRTRTIAWAEETVQLKDYGEARQITLFEHGRVVLQILTSDSGACPAALLGWLKSRWREENFLKYASENYGIDAICDYAANIETNTKITDNPARREAQRRRPRSRKEPGRRRTRPRRPARRPGDHARGQERQADPRRRAGDRRCPPPAGQREEGPRRDPGKAARQPDRPPGASGTAAHRAARPADGAAAAGAQRRALALRPAQRLPARRRRIPRHHPPDHHPRHRRDHHLRPRNGHRHPPAARRAARRPRPGPAPRPGQRRPATDAGRHPAHHLPAHREPGDLTPGRPPLPESV